MFCCRRSLDVLCSSEHVCAHRHVLLLHGGGHGAQVPEVHLVEEVPHRLPDGKLISLYISAYRVLKTRRGDSRGVKTFIIRLLGIRVTFLSDN